MSQTESLQALLAQYPGIKKHLLHISTGDYTLGELYDFNPYSKEELIEAAESYLPGIASEDMGINGVPIVQLDEMYNASLIVKAQVHLLVKLEQGGATFGLM
jgi:hypothetical protein